MGLLKKIKKIGKKIFKGVKKVFKKATKFVGKIAGSKWGKALLIASSVVMGGLAVYGALQGVAAASASGAGFMGKFVAGAKGFMGALANPVATGKQALAGAGQAGASVGQAAQAAGQLQQAGNVAQVAGQAGQVAQAAAPGLVPGAAVPPAAGGGGGGVLAGALDFAKSAGGGKILSGAIQGYAQGKQAEEQRDWEEQQARYYDRAWENPQQTEQLQAATQGYQVPVGGGYLDRAQRVNQVLNERQYRYPNQPGNPQQVAGYARSPGG